jgi:hypothetical protein
MINLAQLEQRLNSDPKARELFLNDPVAVFRKEGIMLSPDQERSLRQAAAILRASAPRVGGSPQIKIDVYLKS